MTNTLKDEINNLTLEQKRYIQQSIKKIKLIKEDFEEKINFDIISKLIIENEILNRKRKIFSLWSEPEYIKTFSNEDINLNIKLKNSIAGKLIEQLNIK
jgi:hypothetical protein